MSKGREIFIKADKRLNWVAGGSLTNTISGRIGFYSNHALLITRIYWVILQAIVDFTFYPMDNWGHCHLSYHADETKGDYKPTDWVVFFFLLSLITVASCLILMTFFYLFWAFGFIKQKKRITLTNV